MIKPPSTSLRGSQISPFRLGWKLGAFRPGLWLYTWLLWTAFVLIPLVTGWFLKLVFDELSSNRSINKLLILIGLSEVVHWIVFAAAIYFVVRWWNHAASLLRTNVLEAQTVSGGPRSATLPGSAAEAISRMRDDVRNTVIWSDSWVDGSGSLLMCLAAVAVMSTINRGAALVVLIPLAVVTAITWMLTPRVHKARENDREAASLVTSFLGEVFVAQLAFRLAGREDAAIARLDRYTKVRRRTAVRDAVLEHAIQGMSSSTSDVTIGLTLLVLAPAVRSGDLGIGDLALFVVYAERLGSVPQYAARLITAREQAVVSFRRLGELLAPDRLNDLVEHRDIRIEPNDEPMKRHPDPVRNPLVHLKVRGLTRLYQGTENGICEIDLDIAAGSFTVITGGIGAGKSTLLRALVGLTPAESGVITWNGSVVDDPASFFVPPLAAHLPQIPRLFSESLSDNILLGREADLSEILVLSTLNEDLNEMPDRLNTIVGARGLRLSGGQLQRVATARSLVTGPELLVVDDLSSALDVSTEQQLWSRLRSGGRRTIIAVSHRQLAIQQADQVITMEGGRIVSVDRPRGASTDPASSIGDQ